MTSKRSTTPDFSTFRLPPVYETVVCERPEINEGLTRPLEITVLVNPARGEIVAMSQQLEAVYARVRARVKAAEEAAARAKEEGTEVPPATDPEAERAEDLALFDVIAHRITGWSVQALNGEGELVDVPAPGQKGGNAHFPMGEDAIPGGGVMELLNQRQKLWILRLVQSAHLGGETRGKLSRRPEATASTGAARTPSGPQVVDIPTTATHQAPRKNC